LHEILNPKSSTLQKDRERNFRADPRGLCILAVGPVLAQLLELTMIIEAIVETDAHVPPQVTNDLVRIHDLWFIGCL